MEIAKLIANNHWVIRPRGRITNANSVALLIRMDIAAPTDTMSVKVITVEHATPPDTITTSSPLAQTTWEATRKENLSDRGSRWLKMILVKQIYVTTCHPTSVDYKIATSQLPTNRPTCILPLSTRVLPDISYEAQRLVKMLRQPLCQSNVTCRQEPQWPRLILDNSTLHHADSRSMQQQLTCSRNSLTTLSFQLESFAIMDAMHYFHDTK
jgi:hypothetical protein